MVLILIPVYSLVCLYFFIRFRDLLPQMSLPLTMLITTVWPVSVLFGYIVGVIRLYRAHKNEK